MKNLLRVPTKEKFAFIEFEFEGSPDEAIEEYNRVTGLVRCGAGLPTFNEWYDNYRTTGKAGTAEDWEQMTDLEKYAVNELKKSLKRTNK